MKPRPKRSLIGGLIAALGVALLGGGAWLFFSPGQADEVERVAALPRAAPADLERAADGAAALVEGRLAPRGRLNPQGLAVYEEEYFVRQETEGASRGRNVWSSRSVLREPIGVERDGQLVPLCNSDYLLVGPPHAWQSDEVPRAGHWGRDATLRRRGFKPGDWLTVDARLARGSAPACLHAKAIFGGDAAGYLEEQRRGVVTLRIVGGVFAGLGALAFGVGLALRRGPKR